MPPPSSAPAAAALGTSTGALGTVSPERLPDGRYRIAGGGLVLVVDPARAGRAVRLALAERELLTPARAEPSDAAFSAEIQGERLLLKSAASADGLRVERSYRLDLPRRAFEVTVALVNASPQARRVEPRAPELLKLEPGLDFGARRDGWLAHVRAGVLCVEAFEPEQPASELAPGAFVSQTTRWHLRALPASVPTERSNPELVGFVKAVVD